MALKLYEGDVDYGALKNWPCQGRIDPLTGDRKYDIFSMTLNDNRALGEEVALPPCRFTMKKGPRSSSRFKSCPRPRPCAARPVRGSLIPT